MLLPMCCFAGAAAGSDIIAAAEKAHDSSRASAASRGSKGGRSSPSTGWLPALPAAYPALLSVLVQTGKMDIAKQLLLAEYEEQLGQQQQQQTSAGVAAKRKGGKAAVASSSSRSGAAAAGAASASGLLAPAVVNSFLLAAVSVLRDSRACQDDDCAEGAAVAAVEVARALFKQPLLLVSMASAGAAVGDAMAAPLKGPQPDASTWASLVELYGYVEQLGLGQREVRMSDIVRAACRQQLPGVQVDGLQCVLAGAAAALNAAQQHTTAVHLLSGLLAAGVQAVSHPQLAAQLCIAADDDEAFDVSATQGCHTYVGCSRLFHCRRACAYAGVLGQVVLLGMLCFAADSDCANGAGGTA